VGESEARKRYKKALKSCIEGCKDGSYTDEDFFELIDAQTEYLKEERK